jgi:hypothetical protein
VIPLSEDVDKEIRYIIDVDIRSKRILSHKEDRRENLPKDHPDPNIVRIFLTKGQYNKLTQRLG